jgi:threonine dehydrogenase-like Zn-dependent dehydrogenase
MAKSQITVRLDKDRLARARKALGAETVTEAIERALALATEKATHDAVIRKYSGVGRKNAFAKR